MTKYVGAHVSIAGGVENAPLNAAEIGATGFAMFTKNQRQWNAPPLKRKAIEEFKALEDDGKSVPDHPPNLSNDLAQCLVGVARGLLTPEKLIDTKKLMNDRRKQLGRNPLKKARGRVIHLKRFV